MLKDTLMQTVSLLKKVFCSYNLSTINCNWSLCFSFCLHSDISCRCKLALKEVMEVLSHIKIEYIVIIKNLFTVGYDTIVYLRPGKVIHANYLQKYKYTYKNNNIRDDS